MGRGHRLPEETTGMIRKMGLSFNSVSVVNIAAGICRSDDDTDDIVTVADTVSLLTSGDGGLDIGVEAISTWYYVWVILNPTTLATGALLSVSSSSPTLPAGFTKKRRIGVVRNNAAGNIIGFVQRGGNNDRLYGYVGPQAVLTNGAADAFTTVSCAAFIPPTNNAAIIELTCEGDGEDGQTAEVQADSSIPGNGTQIFAWGNKNAKNSTNTAKMVTDGSQDIQYRGATGDSFVSIAIMGFDEEV